MTISTDGINNITDADVERINRIRHQNGLPFLAKADMIHHTKTHPAYTDSFDWLEFLLTLGHRVEDAIFGTHHEDPALHEGDVAGHQAPPLADETDPVPVSVGVVTIVSEPGTGPTEAEGGAAAPAVGIDPTTGLEAQEPAPAPVDSSPGNE